MPLATPLSRQPIFASVDAMEAQAFLAKKHFDVEFGTTRSPSVDVCINGAYGSRLYLGYVRYGPGAVTFSPRDFHTEYWLHLPLRGRMRARIDAEEVACDRHRGVLAAPSAQNCRFDVGPDGDRLQIALAKPALLRRLAVLLDDDPREPLRFEPALDLSLAPGRSLAGHVRLAMQDLHDEDGSGQPGVMEALEEFLLTAILLGQPHSYSERLKRRERTIAPRDVKRALDYIRDRAEASNLGIEAIASAAGVPGRTLFQHFRDHLGTTPMGYVRDLRLRRAREALLSAGAGQGVTGIALACGFSHLGRFAAEYRGRYGESPSRTLVEARNGWVARRPAIARHTLQGDRPQGVGTTVRV